MKKTIDIPPPNAIVIFRGDDGKVYFLTSDAKVYLTESYHGVHRIVNPSFTSYDQITGEQIQIIKDTPQEFIFALYRSTQTIISKGGGKKGISGLIVEDEDIELGTFQILNFEGAGVIVTDDGGGKATVTIGGGGMIFGAGTPNRLAMFTAPNTIGDSPFLRSGSDVIADGNLFFASGNGIDVVATGGADVLNIGTTNADVINYGYAGTTHNMNGTVFNVFTTNLNVTDKIITLNDGGAAGSGGNVGFEIEEGGVATGYFIQNTTRDGFDFQASAVTGVATFDLSLLTGNQTATLQDASGILAYLSDIPAPVNAWLLDGNTTAGEYIGTNNAQDFPIYTNAVERGRVDSAGLWGINAAPIAGVQFYIQGTGTTTANKILRLDNGTPTETFSVYSSAQIFAGEETFFNLFVGVNSGLLVNGAGGGIYNTSLGVYSMVSNTTGGSNTGIGRLSLNANTTGSGNTAVGQGSLRLNTTASFNTAIGDHALEVNTASFNTAVGFGALQDNTTGQGNVGVGYLALQNNTTGSENTAMGDGAMSANTTGTNSCAYGANALVSQTTGGGVTGYNDAFGVFSLQTLTTGSENAAYAEYSLNKVTTGTQNTGIGGYAGFGVTTGARNIFLGYFSGFGAGNVSDQLWIDNANNTNPLIFGDLANRNLGLNTTLFGAGATNTFSITNGAAPGSVIANGIQIFSRDSSDALATLGLFTEQSVEAVAAVPDARLKVWLNLAGVLTEYYVALEAV